MKKIVTASIILMMIGVGILSGCTTRGFRDIYDEEGIENFIMGVVDDGGRVYDYYGIKASRVEETSNCDKYRVYGHIQIESVKLINYEFVECLKWATFSVDVYVFDTDITLADMVIN